MEMLYNKLSRLLPVHFFLHVRSIAAAIIGQEQSSIAQPVHIHFYTGAVHDDHVGVGRLSGHLQIHKNEKLLHAGDMAGITKIKPEQHTDISN